MERRGKGVLFRIVFAILGIISGISIFFSFIAFKNIHAAAWGLVSAIYALICLRLLWAYRRDVVLQQFSLRSIRRQKVLGIFGIFATIGAALTYFIAAGVLHQGYQIKNDGYMPAGVFALLTLKWTAFLFCYSKRFEKMYTDGETEPIANGNPPKPLRNSMD